MFCCFSFLIVGTLNVALCVCAPCGLSIGVFHNCLLMFLLPLPTCVPLDVCSCSFMFLLGSVHCYLLTLLVIRIVTIAKISSKYLHHPCWCYCLSLLGNVTCVVIMLGTFPPLKLGVGDEHCLRVS